MNRPRPPGDVKRIWGEVKAAEKAAQGRDGKAC